MSEHSERFIAYLRALALRDRGAIAALRHSRSLGLGEDSRVFAYVERFAGNAACADDPRRLALYAVAGLFAQHPTQAPRSFASAFGELAVRRESVSIGKRFVALLEADASTVVKRLRQAVSLLAADEIGLDYAGLLDDLSSWLAPHGNGQRLARIRQAWGRDYFLAVEAGETRQYDAASFIAYLQQLAARRDRAALAALRQSLAHAPGNYPAAYPHVEPFVAPQWSIFDSRRKARYLVAGIVALNPTISDRPSLAAALGLVARRRESESIEGRFIALLDADEGNIADHLRQVVRLIQAEAAAYNPGRLLKDMETWLNPWADPAWRDRVRQQWARDFYQAVQADNESDTPDTQTEGA